MHVHFIAIGGAAMHSLAIALHQKGHEVTGSDDEIFEPARSQLADAGLLPVEPGWFPEKIQSGVTAVILGMHARCDNTELQKALDLGIPVYSYPEFLFHEAKDKTRVVIAGSHGKTTITSMVMHVLRCRDVNFDYMVGSRIEGFENMVNLDRDNRIAVFEGDEYLSSCRDPRPKFLLYQPQIALISGIAWDHINVFPTWENYIDQFRTFINSMPPEGCLVYCNEDKTLAALVGDNNPRTFKIPYSTPDYIQEQDAAVILRQGRKYRMKVFGRHNMQNIEGARIICALLGISDVDFFTAISGFKGAVKRLQLVGQKHNTGIFLDFAHSPSKVEATVKAVREQFSGRRLIACLELHTFSSLNKAFLAHYRHTLDESDVSIVYYNPETILKKRLQDITPVEVDAAFGKSGLLVFTEKESLEKFFQSCQWKDTILLLMSSGNFSGLDINALAVKILSDVVV